LDRGIPVRVLAEPEQLDGWPGAAEVICGSITRPEEAASAFRGVSRVFLAGAAAQTVGTIVEEAVDAGIERIVVLSSHGPEFEAHYPPETWFWLAIEKAVENSGIAWAHIRPSAVMGAPLEGTYPATGSDWPETIRNERCVREAYLDNGYYPFIHEADLAGVAVAALLRSDLTGRVLEAVGLPLSTRSRIAAIENALGQRIKQEHRSPDASRAAWLAQGWPASAVDVTLYGLEVYGSQLLEQTEWTLRQSPSLEELLGRKPSSFEQWAQDHAQSFLG